MSSIGDRLLSEIRELLKEMSQADEIKVRGIDQNWGLFEISVMKDNKLKRYSFSTLASPIYNADIEKL